jgi:hypothetical protein
MCKCVPIELILPQSARAALQEAERSPANLCEQDKVFTAFFEIAAKLCPS